MRRAIACLLLLTYTINTLGKVESEEDSRDTDRIENSEERIGATVSQVYKHPYAASLLKNNTYVCSAVILNTYWLLALTKCFDTRAISSYLSHKNLGNYTVRTGSSYNNKGGVISQINMLMNNFDFKVSAIKLMDPLIFNSQTGPVNLPTDDSEEVLGHLANIIAWTPTGHIRIVSVPVIDPTICHPDKFLPGQYICVGGVQDPNRHFCRQDNGGAVVQNNTLIAITSFLHTCALYTKIHAFPKISSIARWIDATIWDEGNRATTNSPSTASPTTSTSVEPERNVYVNSKNFMLSLPFEPVNVPLQPAEDNSVIPRMSMYESYLQTMQRAKTSTSTDKTEEVDMGLMNKLMLQKYGKSYLMLNSKKVPGGKYDQYEYTK